MFELVVITCLAHTCTEHIYGELFPSHTACVARSQSITAAFFAEFPQYQVAGVKCRPHAAPSAPA